jgi:hypothetical protein
LISSHQHYYYSSNNNIRATKGHSNNTIKKIITTTKVEISRGVKVVMKKMVILLSEEEVEDDMEDEEIDFPMLISHHPFTRAIYSSVVELEGRQKKQKGNNKNYHNDNIDTDLIYNETIIMEHNRKVETFNSQRHLSRYETFVRIQRSRKLMDDVNQFNDDEKYDHEIQNVVENRTDYLSSRHVYDRRQLQQ